VIRNPGVFYEKGRRLARKNTVSQRNERQNLPKYGRFASQQDVWCQWRPEMSAGRVDGVTLLSHWRVMDIEMMRSMWCIKHEN